MSWKNQFKTRSCFKTGLRSTLDSKFNEFEWRVTEGPVVCAPLKHDTGVEEGDTLYFHHLVVMNEGQVLTGHDNHYLVRYNPDQTSKQSGHSLQESKSGHIYSLGWLGAP